MTITIVLERDDMVISKKNVSKDEIDFSCFNISHMFIERAHTIHFVDDDQSIIVLKERSHDENEKTI